MLSVAVEERILFVCFYCCIVCDLLLLTETDKQETLHALALGEQQWEISLIHSGDRGNHNLPVLPQGSVTTSINLFRTVPGSVSNPRKYYILW